MKKPPNMEEEEEEEEAEASAAVCARDLLFVEAFWKS